MAEKPAQPAEKAEPRQFFSFIRQPLLRKIVEIIISAIPGALIFFIFLVGTGALNIFSNLSPEGTNGVFAATYVPVICILPFVVGVIGPLVLERIRGETRLSMKSSVIVSFLSGFFGSVLGALVLVISSLATSNLKPFGEFITDPLYLAGAFIALVVVTSILSTIGGALIVVLLNKVEK